MIKQKKILLVGYFANSSKIFTYSTSFSKSLSVLGYDVQKFDYRCKSPFLMNFSLKREFKRFRPDLVFFLKAEKVYWTTIRYLKQNSNATLINFYPDNPFTFWNGNSNSDVLKSLPFFDYFLIWAEQLVPVISAAGARKVAYFPFAFDGDMFSVAVKLDDSDLHFYSSDVCFAGSWDEARQRWLERLLEKMPNLKLAVWGDRWRENLADSSYLKKFIKGNAIYGVELLKAFRASKIVLNFIRKQNLNAHNMRTFEVPASKAFMLTQYTDEQAKLLFKEGQSIECFKNLEELVFKVDFFLKNEHLRLERIKNGFIVVQEYYLNKQLFNFFKKINF